MIFIVQTVVVTASDKADASASKKSVIAQSNLFQML